MPSFKLQPNHDISRMEKSAVRQACAVGLPGATVVPASHGPDPSVCPVGSVEFVREWMRLAGVREPEPIDYPTSLHHALGRSVVQVPYAQARHGCWIKPLATKAWAPRILDGAPLIGPDEPVWESDPIAPEQFLGEWRVYVLGGAIVGHGRYDDDQDERITYDAAQVHAWVDTYTASGQAPAGYALDVARMADGRTILVEVTDGWAIGYYRGTCSPADYAGMLAARWAEIAGG